MSNIKIYIGTDLLDFNDEINVKRQVNDYRDIDVGSLTTSYPIDIPLTKTNRKLLKYFGDPRSRVEVSSQARIILEGIEVIRGKFRIFGSSNGETVRAIVEGNDWLDGVNGVSIQDLDWSGLTHALTKSNVSTSWNAAAGAFYRYPLINWGQLWSEETGASAIHLPYDFVPAWNIGQIVEKIINTAGYELASGGYFDGTAGKKKYILSQPVPADPDFIENKGLSVYVDNDADNYDSDTVGGGGSASVTINKVLDIGAETTDEGSDFNLGTDRYVAPADGTYRFRAQIRVATNAQSSSPDWTNTAQYINWSIRKNGTPVVSYSDTESNPPEASIFDNGNNTFTLDTGWIHLSASDYIDIHLNATMAATNDAGGGTLELYVTSGSSTSYLDATWDERNLWPGLNYTCDPSVMLPDIESVALLRALKSKYNLRFFVDQMNKKVYIESADDFFGSTVVDLSDKMDYSAGYDMDSIASSYDKYQELRYIADEADRAYNDYIAANPGVFTKEITLTSEYVQQGKTERECEIFAATAVGVMTQKAFYADSIPRIFGDAEFLANYRFPEYRAKKWIPRLLNFEGYNALDGSGQIHLCDYPDATPTDYSSFCEMKTDSFQDLYDDYMKKDWARIDKNKVLSCTLKMSPLEIMKFITVVGTAANEGFRAIYLINIEGVDMYWICSKIVTDGDRIKGEFVQKL